MITRGYLTQGVVIFGGVEVAIKRNSLMFNETIYRGKQFTYGCILYR